MTPTATGWPRCCARLPPRVGSRSTSSRSVWTPRGRPRCTPTWSRSSSTCRAGSRPPAPRHRRSRRRRAVRQVRHDTSLAVLSGQDRRGVWEVGQTHTALSLMGGITLDLRQAVLTSRETTIHAYAVMGGVEVIVNAGTRVSVEGFGVMGAFEEQRARVEPALGPASPGAGQGPGPDGRSHRGAQADAGGEEEAPPAARRPLGRELPGAPMVRCPPLWDGVSRSPPRPPSRPARRPRGPPWPGSGPRCRGPR